MKYYTQLLTLRLWLNIQVYRNASGKVPHVVTSPGSASECSFFTLYQNLLSQRRSWWAVDQSGGRCHILFFGLDLKKFSKNRWAVKILLLCKTKRFRDQTNSEHHVGGVTNYSFYKVSLHRKYGHFMALAHVFNMKRKPINRLDSYFPRS